MTYATTPLSTSHDKAAFSCGNRVLDHYIQKQARQDIKGKVAVCIVQSDDNKIIKGYYTLSNSSIKRSIIPETIFKNLPKYQELPVTLLGRLAIDNRYKGKGSGSMLLIDALRRSYETSINSVASMAVIVDPIDEVATAFYTKFGFIPLPDSKRMFLPMTTIGLLFK
jgi:predicted GNAT family N-acyltransferase